MIAQQKKSLIMLVLLGAGIFIYNLGVGICYARGVEPLPAVDFLYNVVLICGTVWWLQAETKKSAVTQVYCPGVLITAVWPFVIPYHLIKTRGVRGLLPLFALIGAFGLAKTLGAVIYLAFVSSL